MTFDEWVQTIPEDERSLLSLCDAWDAAVKATVQALLDYGNLDEDYRKEWTSTANRLRSNDLWD